MSLGKAFFMTWILQFMNDSKLLCIIFLNLVSNNRHIVQLILAPSADKLADHPRVMYSSVYSGPLSFAEIDQIYTTLLYVQKMGIKHCVLIKVSLSF